MVFGSKQLFNLCKNQLSELEEAQYSEREISNMLLWLFESSLRVSQVDILLDKKIDLPQEQFEILQQQVQRINKEEPIQYVLGECEFYGRKFFVDPSVLIPRQETEELVSLIIKEQSQSKGLRLLDIGTGSGCIAITLAKELSDPKVFALDYSTEALEIAKKNAKRLNAVVNFSQVNILTESPDLRSIDIVVSNPPYVRDSEANMMRRNVLNYEPHSALFVEDADPLLFYRRILELCTQEFSSIHCLYVEVNERLASEVANLFLARSYFSSVRIESDAQKKERFVIGQM